jgi:protein-tyrosine phosphatase
MEVTIHPRVKNSKPDFPQIFYGKHLTSGCAEYADGPDGKPYRVFISEDVAKQMDPSFAARPCYVDHVDGETPDAKNKTVQGTVQDEKGNSESKICDGYIIESFFLPVDGSHWVKFLVTSQQGADAIARGWKLSNCYTPLSLGPGGSWHGIEYSREFLAAEYNHCAIVEHPRYTESIILTPEAFKSYCSEKEAELVTMRNSVENVQKIKVEVKFPEGEKSMKKPNLLDMMFGKKNGKIEKIENAAAIGNVEVRMGKNRSASIADLVAKAAVMNDADYEKLMKDSADEDVDMEVENDLEDLKEKNKKKSSIDEDEMENEDELDEDKKNDEKNTPADEKLENEERVDQKEMENEEDEDAKMKALREAQNKKNKMKKNAEKNTPADEKLENEERVDQKEMENDDEDENPLMNVINMDGEDTTVGDLINSHVNLKNKYNALRQKHNDLREEYSDMKNTFGEDDAFENDTDIPKRDEEMQEALGKLENQEKCLENSLERRRNSIAKIIGKMKNSADAVAKREQKKQDGVENFKKIQNAELEAMINSAAGPVTPTETSRSMVERGQKRYGSGN